MLEKVYGNIHDEFAIWFNVEAMRIFYGEDLNKLDKEISKLKWLLHPPSKRKGQITPLMIQKAKEYPFERLIKLRNNFAICPFHPDKNPSFHVKANRGHCFGCGWSGDAIKFVMETHRLGFREAVQYLLTN
jgi:hypothetical protein